MSDMETRLVQAFEDAIIHHVKRGDFVMPDYANRLKIDPALLHAAWSAVDRTKVIARLTAHIEETVADKILHSMATEVANDVKQIMSNKELREDVRGIIRARIREHVAAVTEPTS